METFKLPLPRTFRRKTIPDEKGIETFQGTRTPVTPLGGRKTIPDERFFGKTIREVVSEPKFTSESFLR